MLNEITDIDFCILKTLSMHSKVHKFHNSKVLISSEYGSWTIANVILVDFSMILVTVFLITDNVYLLCYWGVWRQCVSQRHALALQFGRPQYVAITSPSRSCKSSPPLLPCRASLRISYVISVTLLNVPNRSEAKRNIKILKGHIILCVRSYY